MFGFSRLTSPRSMSWNLSLLLSLSIVCLTPLVDCQEEPNPESADGETDSSGSESLFSTLDIIILVAVIGNQ